MNREGAKDAKRGREGFERVIFLFLPYSFASFAPSRFKSEGDY
jgi:hypothetical protein